MSETIQIPAAQIEINEAAGTIYVHAPDGSTLIRISVKRPFKIKSSRAWGSLILDIPLSQDVSLSKLE